MSSNTPSVITSFMLYEKLLSVEQLLKKVVQKNDENDIEEFSLSRAAKYLHIGQEKFLELIEGGLIKARKIPSKKSETGYSYKIAKREIHRFQNCDQYSPDEIDRQPQTDVDIARNLINNIHNNNRSSNDNTRFSN